jgi:transposase
LPTTAYEYAEWKRARVHIDYHIEVERHYYSVPHTLIKRQLDVRMTVSTLECFHKGQRVAAHRRSHLPGRHTTVTEHMPEQHRHHAQFSPERLQRWAANIGIETATLITQVLSERPHPEQGYRACLGILRLAKSYSDERLNAAYARALILGTHRYKSIASILKKRLDQQPLNDINEPQLPTDHGNLRGPGYYH